MLLDECEVIIESEEIDSIIFSGDKVWRLTREEQERLRDKFVRKAFLYHLNTCDDYADFVRRKLGPTSVDFSAINLADIPLIPTSAYKQNVLQSVDNEAVAKWCLSSGTNGLRSRVPRDKISLDRLVGSLNAGSELLKHYYEHEVEVLNLGPDKYEAGDVWFSYVMSLIEVLYPTTCFVNNSVFQIDKVILELEYLEQQATDVLISSPPFLVMELVNALKAKGRRFDFGNRLTVITAGGWKKRTGEAVSREQLIQSCRESFGLESDHQCRDIFNQVELNTIIFECSEGNKHLPPWVAAYARSPVDLKALPEGEEGLMSFLDASANSYPCFYVGDDLGTVKHVDCACGIKSKTISITRRVQSRDTRGCATSIITDAT
jgi:long-chain-fatty-acid---luciferin-component ligase